MIASLYKLLYRLRLGIIFAKYRRMKAYLIYKYEKFLCKINGIETKHNF